MKDSIKNRKNKFLALCLSVMMCSSIAALAACKDDTATDSSSSSSSSSSVATSEEKDEKLIKNSDFETFDSENVLNTSVTGWTRAVNSSASGSALTSKAASGILDLGTDAWHNLTGSNFQEGESAYTLTVEDAKARWDTLTVKDKLAYYEVWEEQNKDKKIAEELDFYETLGIATADIPTISHFDTHDGAVANDKENTKVLMIHNQYPETDKTTGTAYGTAQKYTSSSTVTVKAGTAAKFSVWVKTQDLESGTTDGGKQDAVDKGAYISITHSVGGKTLDAYKVENINTETLDLTATNGWKQYSFYLKGSSFTDTTFSLELGLGQGGGSYRGEYVNGYAFFDDIVCEIIDNEKFEEEVGSEMTRTTFDQEGEEKIVNAYASDVNKFALDFHGAFVDSSALLSDVSVSATETNGVTSVAGNNTASWLSGGRDGSKDVNGVFKAADIQTAAPTLYDKYFANDATFAEKDTLLLLSMNGAAYTATPQKTVGEVKSAYEFEVKDYLALSFFVKTSEMEGYTGAGVTLHDGTVKTSFDAIDTTTATALEINGDKVYGDWQQYFFFVKNDTDNETAKFTLSFHFGPTAIGVDNKLDSYHPGFAAFTAFESYSMSETEYESAQSGTNAKVVSLLNGKEETTDTESGFDAAISTPSNALENGLAHLKNYKGIHSNSAFVTGKGDDDFNSYADAGLLSKEAFTAADGYAAKALQYRETNGQWEVGTPNWLLSILGKDATVADLENIWNKTFGNSTLPVYIYDDGNENAFGYIGSETTTIAANTYQAVSVRVRGTANAYIRLVDTNGDNYDTLTAYNKPLSIGRNLTFWYDDEGNVCTADPAGKHQIAFKLQSNGLYKANKSGWDDYSKLTSDQQNAFYANLNAYTQKNENGDLLVAKTGASHNYTSYWNNEGMDGIAFYNKDGVYYADKACTVPVYNLASVEQLSPRYTAIDAAGQKLEASVTPTSGEWSTVTFYIHTGDVAKNYRLEIWSGDSALKGNAQGTYLAVDTSTPPADETTFNDLLTAYDEKVAEENKFSGVFSYFDTANHLRYDASLDENNIGNLYEENYVPSSYSEGIAYLTYKATTDSKTDTVIFADYQYSEKAVTAAAQEDDSASDDSSDDENDSDTNVWLLASSLSVAGVLLLAIASIVIRKLIVKARKKRAAQSTVKNNKKSK